MATLPASDAGPSPDTAAPGADAEIETRRLRWQCRRGMLELDHLLAGFLDVGYGELSSAQRIAFARLLSEEDQRLSDWLLSRAVPPDPALRELTRRIVEAASRGRRP